MKYKTSKRPKQLIINVFGSVECPVCKGTNFTAKESNPLERSVIVSIDNGTATYELDDDFNFEQIIYDMFCDKCGQEVFDDDGDQQF